MTEGFAIEKHDVSPPLSREEERELLPLAQGGDEEALDRVVKSNIAFVAKIAYEYEGRGVHADDLLAEGCDGMMEAIKRFDADKGYKFISYAVWWIRQRIRDSISRNYTVKRPTQLGFILQKYHTVKNKMGDEGHKNDFAAVCDEMELPERVRVDISAMMRGERSLDVEKNDDMGWGGSKIGKGDKEYTDIKPAVKKMLKILNNRERRLMSLYYGLDGEPPKTLQQIGDQIGITRERVRQINQRSLLKLQAHMRGKFTLESLTEEEPYVAVILQ